MKNKRNIIFTIILFCISELTIGQVSILTTVRPAASPWSLGWDGTGGNNGSLEIRNDFAGQPINFLKGVNPLATLDANGNFSIGQTSTTNYFGIGAYKVLWHNGNPNDIFVGVSAGNGAMSGHNNSFMGNSAGTALTIGTDNTAIGFEALLKNHTGSNNTAVGSGALHEFLFRAAPDSEAENTAVGVNALYNNKAYGGCALGFRAGYNNTYGCSLIAIGEEAAVGNILGSYNTAIGEASLKFNDIFSSNVAVGFAALEMNGYTPLTYPCSSATPGCLQSYNVAVGNAALSRTYPTSYSGSLAQDGMQNTAIGTLAGATNVTGFNNSFLGNKADVGSSTTNLSNSAAIGANATVVTDNTMILGNQKVSVGIGMSGITSGPAAKLHVFRDNLGDGGVTPTAAYIDNADKGDLAFGLDVYTHGGNANNIGIESDVDNAASNLAGNFWAGGQATENVGVYGYAYNAYADNIGVSGSVVNYDGKPGYFDAAIFGNAPTNSSWPSSTFTGSWAGYFNGDLAYTGTFGSISDSSLKINVHSIDSARTWLHRLNCHSYYYDTAQFAHYINFSKKLQFGLMAQEVEAVLPNLVINSVLPPKIDSLGNILVASTPVKMINYMGIIPLLIQGVNEQQHVIDSLHTNDSIRDTRMNDMQNQINQLQQTVTNCCNAGGAGHRTINTQSIELSSANSIILNQNDPNPFAEQTTITYSIPADVNKAELIFFDNNGRVLKTVMVNERGPGQLIVYASNLSNGIYSYSLVADGKVVDTKKMVKQN